MSEKVGGMHEQAVASSLWCGPNTLWAGSEGVPLTYRVNGYSNIMPLCSICGGAWHW
jgi:hypothetical protein